MKRTLFTALQFCLFLIFAVVFYWRKNYELLIAATFFLGYIVGTAKIFTAKTVSKQVET